MRIVPQLDTYPRLVSFCQTALGKAALLGVFAFGLFIDHLSLWIELAIAVSVMAYFPARRRLLASVAALYWLLFHCDWLDLDFLRALADAQGLRSDWTLTALLYGVVAAVFCSLALFFHAVLTRRKTRATKRPVMTLMFVYALVLAAGALMPIGGVTRLILWCVIVVMAHYLWYFAYSLKDALAKTPDGPILQFGTLHPFWSGTSLPFTKGAAYLRKIEARNPKDLSVTQLKAIKLLIWVAILHVLQQALNVLVYGMPATKMYRSIGLGLWTTPHLAIPTLEAAVQMPALAVPVAWASLIAHFAQAMLNMAGYFNLYIATCRMAGFNALRSSYRPLQSQTVAEFWNRYNYYFKELLVEFFFFPVFTRYFKQYRRLRLFAATIAAATLGNMIFHFFRDYRYVAEMGLWQALVGFQVYAFYATVLGLGIGFSQLRSHGRERSRGEWRWWRRATATVGVLFFFCLLEIFDQEGRSYGLGPYWHFFLRLFLIPA